MKILFISAEVAPFVSVGGLSQVLYFLPNALQKIGHDVRIFTPKYGSMNPTSREGEPWNITMEMQGLHVPIANHNLNMEVPMEKKDYIICNVKTHFDAKRNLRTYLLENREYYELRANVFGYMDDHVRFALLSKGCLEWLLQMKRNEHKENFWWPDIIHCNDWHTAYLINMARRDQRYKQVFAKTAIVFTVHNFAYQGNYDFRFVKKEDNDDGTSELEDILSPKLQRQNALKRGLLYADAINTVSPTHALEILMPEYSEGLDKTIEKAKGKLTGILNGLDTDEFNPATDPIIKKTFSFNSFVQERRENKIALQKIFLLPIKPDAPVFAFSGRLCQQKGVDLLLEVLPHLFDLRRDIQAVILGGGDDRYRNALVDLQKKYPKRLGLHLQPDFRLPRKIFAGADIFLIPSSYEPGGIVALEALRYGSVPIVRRTGGLNDIVEDFDPEKGTGHGFSFEEKDSWALYGSIIEALTIYKQPLTWEKLVANCLQRDFSWDHVAKEYDEWYHHVVEERKRAVSSTPHPVYQNT